MARFNEEWMNQLLDRSDIVDVIGEYVHLTRKGTRYWAPCPWHAERNPSFSVTPEKQMFYCFSCKKGGGVINFIMEQENLTYSEAVEFLAQRAGMEMPEVQDDEAYQKKKRYEKRLHEMMRELALFYHDNLKKEEGKEALEYVQKRKIGNVINTFGIGYALNEYDSAYRYLLGKGYSLREMLDAGLVRSRDGKTYDFFRDRVMFPIQNAFGDVIAFGGRIYKEGEPKYLNSGETTIFNKRRNLYALNMVRKKRNLRSIILTEGYVDVVSLRAVGIDYAVASLGTALTENQVRLIKKYTQNVYVCYDGDSAGIHAALRALDMLAKEGLRSLVIVMPDGMDPDDVAKKYGKEGFLKLQDSAIPGMEFKLKILKQDYDLRVEDQAVDYATKAVAMISSLDNEIEKEKYLKMVSNETKLSLNSLQKQMEKTSARPSFEQKTEVPEPEEEGREDEERLISLIMSRPDLLKDRSRSIEDMFRTPLYKEVIEYIFTQLDKGSLPAYGEILSAFSEHGSELARDLNLELDEGVAIEEYGDRLVNRILKERLRSERKKLITEYSDTGISAEERNEKIKEISRIDKDLRNINHRYFRG